MGPEAVSSVLFNEHYDPYNPPFSQSISVCTRIWKNGNTGWLYTDGKQLPQAHDTEK
jgi:hypothetical protein